MRSWPAKSFHYHSACVWRHRKTTCVSWVCTFDGRVQFSTMERLLKWSGARKVVSSKGNFDTPPFYRPLTGILKHCCTGNFAVAAFVRAGFNCVSKMVQWHLQLSCKINGGVIVPCRHNFLELPTFVVPFKVQFWIVFEQLTLIHIPKNNQCQWFKFGTQNFPLLIYSQYCF